MRIVRIEVDDRRNCFYPGMAGFRAWLDKAPDGGVVGMRTAPADCPLARWLQAMYQAPALVSAMVYLPYGKEGCQGAHRIPQWAVTFMREVDKKSPAFAMSTPVMKEEALAILEALKGIQGKHVERLARRRAAYAARRDGTDLKTAQRAALGAVERILSGAATQKEAVHA